MNPIECTTTTKDLDHNDDDGGEKGRSCGDDDSDHHNGDDDENVLIGDISRASLSFCKCRENPLQRESIRREFF